MNRIAITLAAAAIAFPVVAAPPAPAKPVPASFFTGRWYEIARTPNSNQKDCEAPTYDFTAKSNGGTAFVLTCRKGSPTGKANRLNVTLRVPTDAARNKFRVTGLAGIINQEYWILDRADDNSWSILATPGGNYVWLLSRNPNMDPAVRDSVLTRIRGMGYRTLVQPKHA